LLLPASASPWVSTIAPMPYVLVAAPASRVMADASNSVASYARPDVPGGREVRRVLLDDRQRLADSPTTV
jgi:hypothetical protein